MIELPEDDEPDDVHKLPLNFTWSLPPLPKCPDLLILATELAGIGGPDLPIEVTAIDSFAAVTDPAERSLTIIARMDVSMTQVFLGDRGSLRRARDLPRGEPLPARPRPDLARRPVASPNAEGPPLRTARSVDLPVASGDDERLAGCAGGSGIAARRRTARPAGPDRDLGGLIAGERDAAGALGEHADRWPAGAATTGAAGAAVASAATTAAAAGGRVAAGPGRRPPSPPPAPPPRRRHAPASPRHATGDQRPLPPVPPLPPAAPADRQRLTPPVPPSAPR